MKTAPRDGSAIVVLANGMECEARYFTGVDSWDDEGTYTGTSPVWSLFDDAIEFEVEEERDPSGEVKYYDGSVTHWRPKTPLPDGIQDT